MPRRFVWTYNGFMDSITKTVITREEMRKEMLLLQEKLKQRECSAYRERLDSLNDALNSAGKSQNA